MPLRDFNRRKANGSLSGYEQFKFFTPQAVDDPVERASWRGCKGANSFILFFWGWFYTRAQVSLKWQCTKMPLKTNNSNGLVPDTRRPTYCFCRCVRVHIQDI